MHQPEPQSVPFMTLMSDIQQGLVKIPQFQREFVWSKGKSAQLLDSIIKGYPIGTFILWKTKESLRTVRNLGATTLPPTPAGEFTQHVLDGQQRLTSLFATVKGLKIRRDEREDDFSQIFIDLTASEDDAIAIADPEGKADEDLVSVRDLVSAGLKTLNAYPEKYHERLDLYKQRLTSYSFSTILVKEAPLDVATEIFTRINVSGKPLTVFEIMVAKTFDAKKNFDLAEKYSTLQDKLRQVSYETISSSTVLQAVSAIMVGECRKRDILHLNKSQFIGIWGDVESAIEEAVDYLRNQYRIPVSHLLPYAALIVPFAYFFYHHQKKPSGLMRKRMADLFWRVSLGGHYSHSLETRLAQDIKRVDLILDDKPASYDYPVDCSCRFVTDNGWFNAGRSFVKAILCVYAYNLPRSFNDDALVRISNDWLKRANSKNYHHFFPRAYLAKQGYEDWEINHIVNITIVDDYLNKRLIRDKAPSRYMSVFNKENSKLSGTMKTHLIDLNADGVWQNDYQVFFDNRCKRLSKALCKRIIPQSIDDVGQSVRTDDYDEAASTEEA